MNIKRIATVSLTYEDFPSFDAKLEEACRLVTLAAAKGATLVVLPETLNQWRGDGPHHPEPLTIDQMALEDWQSACGKLLACATKHAVAITVPVYVRQANSVLNVFYLVDGRGNIIGRYEKEHPTLGELDSGVVPGTNFDPGGQSSRRRTQGPLPSPAQYTQMTLCRAVGRSWISSPSRPPSTTRTVPSGICHRSRIAS